MRQSNVSIGDIFNRLEVVEYSHMTSKFNDTGHIVYTRHFWKCKCTHCGSCVTIRQDNLLNGNSASCGCLRDEYRASITSSGVSRSKGVIDLSTGMSYTSISEYAKSVNVSRVVANYRKRMGYVSVVK